METEVLDIIHTMQRNEATDMRIYAYLAKHQKVQKNKDVLLRMAEDEARHCRVWEGYTKRPSHPYSLKVFWYCLLGAIFGLTFAVHLLEKGEDDAAITYEHILKKVPDAQQMMADERRHENELMEMLEEEKLKYIGSMILGLNDALVELTGALAGFTLALGNNETVGLAGFITGVAATLSMAASEYLSKKSDPTEKSPLRAAIYTGIAYMITVALLLLPYFVFASPFVALGCCLFAAALVIFCFTYFVSVVRMEPFWPKFLEMLCISFVVALISFLIGFAAKTFMGLDL